MIKCFFSTIINKTFFQFCLWELVQLIRMRTMWIMSFVILLMRTDARHQQSTGSLGNQTALLLHDFTNCISRTHPFSLNHLHKDVLWCLRKRVSHCIPKKPSLYSTSMTLVTRERDSYCGSIWTMEKNVAMHFVKDILIYVIDKHYLHFSFVYFNFSLSRYLLCSQHALVLMSERNESYCGIRIPWTFIRHENSAYFTLIISKYRAYHLQLVYSSFTMSWLRQLTMLKKNYCLPGQMWSISWNMIDTKIKNYEYFMTTSPNKKIGIHLLGKISNILMQIFDGHGPLSNIVLDLQKENPLKNRLIRTTAFSTFLTIRPISINTFSRFKIIISSVKQTNSPGCNHFLQIRKHTWEHEFESLNWRNIYCEVNITIPHEDVHLTVKSFTFSGPTMISDLSPYTCQYGGLLVYVDQGDKYFTICEIVYNLHLRGQSIRYYFAWFSGYSHGKISLLIESDRCSIVYAELSPSWDISNTEVEMKLDKSTGCSSYICPPPNIDSETICVIKLESSQPLGPTEIYFGRTYELKSCDSKIQLFVQNVDAMGWPFHVEEAGQRRYSVKQAQRSVYYHLYNATLTFSQTHCRRDHYFMRVYIGITISSCELHPELLTNQEVFLANNIYSLRDCRKFVDIRFPHKGKYINFIYRDSGASSSHGYYISMRYKSCPMRCRGQKYNVYVLDVDGKTVLQYTTFVGNNILTRDHHRGFRVSLTAKSDDKFCQRYCMLQLELKPLGEPDDLDMTTLRLQGRRWVQLY